MSSPQYVELHARSAFSFLRGASMPEKLAETAGSLGMGAIGLCDRDGVQGAPRLYTECREHGVRAIVGTELTMEDGTVVPLLVETRAGYRNLCRLITTCKQRRGELAERGKADRPPGSGEHFDPRARKQPCFAPWSELATHADGLVALTGDEDGPVRAALCSGDREDAERAIGKLLAIFGRDRLFVEVQRHHVRGENREVDALAALAKRHRLPLLATNGPLHATAESREIADVFTCLRNHTHLDAAGVLLARNGERHLKPAAAMARLFADMPEAVANTGALADRLGFTLRDLGYQFPRYAVPEGETMDTFLRKLVFFGAEQRYGGLSPKVRSQLERELGLITRLGFSGYFLVVWDIVNFCRERHILVQGRGSAANSIVCYALGLTAVDPIACNLLFERFLSEGRVGADGHPSWPDIDLDLPSGDRREEAIQELFRRYGPRGAAMTANVITYRGRSAVREIGKALNFPTDLLDRFSSLYAGGDYPHTLGLQEQLAQAGIAANHPRAPAMVRLYGLLHGLPRHLGQHSGGMVVCQGGLDEVVPLEPATMPGRSIVQWDKDDCEELGIVKVDLLGLGMMAVLQDSMEMCRARGRPVDLAHIPKDDPAVFDMMEKADTIGVFQIESRAQMATLPRMKPRNFYDVAVQVAIIRPGPIVGKAVHPYLNRRAGREPVTYMDERLKPIVERTLGIVLFQEQILKIAMVMGGFTASQAEELRRAMGFSRKLERMLKVKAQLREALERNKVAPPAVESIIQALGSFALYGFPESHALSFALIAYASTWLKVHRPAEFFAGLLNNQPMGFYSRATLVQDAKRHGIRVKPVCVLVSEAKCTVENDTKVRLGFNQVKSLETTSVETLLRARAERAFDSAADFMRRAPMSASERRALALVGALNALPGTSHRREALWRVEEPVEQGDLFSYAGTTLVDAELSPLETMTHLERMQADYAGLDLTTGIHPVAALRASLKDVWRAADLKEARNGTRVTIAGAVICRQRPGTAKGFVFVSLEDETGIANAVVRPDLFEDTRMTVTQEPLLRITGPVQNIDNVIHVKAERIEALQADSVPRGVSHDFH
jgi:error-prone DNA polymerase